MKYWNVKMEREKIGEVKPAGVITRPARANTREEAMMKAEKSNPGWKAIDAK